MGDLKRDDLPSVLEPKWPQKDSSYIIDLDAVYDIYVDNYFLMP